MKFVASSMPVTRPLGRFLRDSWIYIGLALLSACATQPPKQIVQYQTVEVPKYIRAPIDPKYIQDCMVIEPKPGSVWYLDNPDGTKQTMQPCFIGKNPALCNGQVSIMVDDYRSAIKQCNLDKAALRQLQPQPEDSH